jgi:hypothetical protein
MRKNIFGFLAVALLAACGSPGNPNPSEPLFRGYPSEAEIDSRFSSAEAILVDFEFQGAVIAPAFATPASAAKDQLLYTIGQLNEHRSVGRLDKLELLDLQATDLGDGSQHITYRAKLPVAWGNRNNWPRRYELILPADVRGAALQAFVGKYGVDCVDWAAHDVSSGNLWYYYRPLRSGCVLDEADLFRTEATVALSAENTTGKYPEYDMVWEDGALEVVAIFGKYEDGAVSSGDAGISAYNAFIRSVRQKLAPHALTTIPAEIPSSPGVAVPDITFQATLPDGRRVQVTALLVDNVRVAGPVFDARYEQLSPSADVILYNGHAGLGSNVKALVRKGKFVAGKYLIVFMNGCDTFAYVDGALAQARALLNPDDPTGTKYMEIITNAMPAFFSSLPSASMALIGGLMAYEAPSTYEQIFTKIDRSQVVVVTGEEDNTFVPSEPSPIDPGVEPSPSRVP